MLYFLDGGGSTGGLPLNSHDTWCQWLWFESCYSLQLLTRPSKHILLVHHVCQGHAEWAPSGPIPLGWWHLQKKTNQWEFRPPAPGKSTWILTTIPISLSLRLKYWQCLWKFQGFPATHNEFPFRNPWDSMGMVKNGKGLTTFSLLGGSSHDGRKWLITMVKKSPKDRVFLHFQMAFLPLHGGNKWGAIRTNYIQWGDPPSSGGSLQKSLTPQWNFDDIDRWC